MRTSELTDKLFAALVKFQSELKPVSKDTVNPAFPRAKYADLAGIFDEVLPLMTANGLGIIQESARHENMARITTRIIHNSNQWIESDLDLMPAKEGPQAFGSAFTYGRRYAMQSLLGITAEEDDDGNRASQPSHGRDEPNRQPSQPPKSSAPIQPKSPPAGLPPTSSGPVPKGFNKNMQQHQVFLSEVLNKRNVPPHHWDEIANRMHGRPSTEMDKVITEYIEHVENIPL